MGGGKGNPLKKRRREETYEGMNRDSGESVASEARRERGVGGWSASTASKDISCERREEEGKGGWVGFVMEIRLSDERRAGGTQPDDIVPWLPYRRQQARVLQGVHRICHRQ